MKKIQTLVLGLTFSLLVLSCFALEQIGVAQVEPESNLSCQDLPGCGGNMACGTKGTANHCYLTCEDGTLLACRND